MEAALWELAEGDADEEVEVIIRLHHPGLTPPGVRIVTQFGAIATCRLPRRDIVRVRRDERVASMKAPMVVLPGAPVPAAETAWEPTGDSDVRRPRAQPETGRGVVVGVIDWGCDFTHPNFRHPDGRTRLIALWDQTAPHLPARANRYGYGVVHAAADIDRALRAERPDQALGYDWRRSDPGDGGAHGTHVLDIAAGSGALGPAGVAPEAELVFVHLASRALPGQAALGDSVCLLEAVDFIFRVAGDRPVCINTSMGRQMGSHDGSSLVEQAFDAALTGVPGRFIGQSTGNYYDRGAHAAGQLRPGQTLSIPFLVGEADVTPNELEVWYAGRDVLGVQVRAPTGELSRKTLPDDESTLRLAGHDACRVYHRAREPNNLDNTIHVYLYAGAPPGRWELVLTGEDVVDGRFNAWIERDAGCLDCQARFEARMAVALSTTGSIANGFRPVAVGAYDAHDPERRLGRFSSAGPTRDGRIKPDLVAPGVEVLAARSTPRAPDDDQPRLVRKSGTSMAAPHVTGTVALMFQAAGRPLHIQEVRNLLLTSTQPAELAHDSVHRVGSGYLDTDAAIAATRAYVAGGAAPRLPGVDREAAPLAEPFDPSAESAPAEAGEMDFAAVESAGFQSIQSAANESASIEAASIESASSESESSESESRESKSVDLPEAAAAWLATEAGVWPVAPEDAGGAFESDSFESDSFESDSFESDSFESDPFGGEWSPSGEGAGEAWDQAGSAPELIELAEAVLDPYGRQSPRDHFDRVFARAGTAAATEAWGPAERDAWEQVADLDAVRTAVRRAANAEMAPWRTGGVLLHENAAGQLGHLVRYWLATHPGIRPDLLSVIQARTAAITYPPEFFAPRPGGGPVRAALVTARQDLLSTLPPASVTAALRTAVEGRLVRAFRSFHDDKTPWSAAFVLACIRKVAIDLGLERMDGATHRGRHTLLRVTTNGRHLDYVAQAHARRSSTGLTYRAALPTAEPVAVGDIIAMDRGATRARDVISLTRLPATGATHGDIVVAVNTGAGYALTVGGNLGDPQEPDASVTPARDSVRCRRFPLAADGRLQVAAGVLYTQEKNAAGTFQPAVEAGALAAGRLERSATQRIFALLRLTSA